MPIVVLNVDESNPEEFNQLIRMKPCVARFHMEGCGHCTAMEPAWNSVISELRNQPDLEGGIVDFNSRAMHHAPPNIQNAVKGFPTILSLDAGGKIVGNFSGPREKDPLKQFSEKHLKKHKKRKRKQPTKKRKTRTVVGGGKKKTRRGKRTKSRKGGTVTSGLGFGKFKIKKKTTGTGVIGEAMGAQKKDEYDVGGIKFNVRKNKNMDNQEDSSNGFCNIL